MQAFCEKYKPGKLADFRGLARPRKIMQTFVEKPYASAWLFVGNSGIGKTSMAFAIQRSLTGDLHHIPAKECNLETVQKTCIDCHYVPWHGRFHTVVVDEADQMTKPAQVAFLSVLDGTDLPPNTVFIFTANDTSKLETRFLSRCRVIEFSGADIDIPEILRSVWAVEAQGRPAPDFDAIAASADGNVRTALMDLELEWMAREPETIRRWFDALGRELAWSDIEARLASGDFAGVRMEECYAA